MASPRAAPLFVVAVLALVSGAWSAANSTISCALQYMVADQHEAAMAPQWICGDHPDRNECSQSVTDQGRDVPLPHSVCLFASLLSAHLVLCLQISIPLGPAAQSERGYAGTLDRSGLKDAFSGAQSPTPKPLRQSAARHPRMSASTVSSRPWITRRGPQKLTQQPPPAHLISPRLPTWKLEAWSAGERHGHRHRRLHLPGRHVHVRSPPAKGSFESPAQGGERALFCVRSLC